MLTVDEFVVLFFFANQKPAMLASAAGYYPTPSAQATAWWFVVHGKYRALRSPPLRPQWLPQTGSHPARRVDHAHHYRRPNSWLMGPPCQPTCTNKAVVLAMVAIDIHPKQMTNGANKSQRMAAEAVAVAFFMRRNCRKEKRQQYQQGQGTAYLRNARAARCSLHY
ncbi:hypothetical protein [Phnomibacter ginsenosidimutans]|uniref:hypothetical protein n=1 Tax=Phnomibacter ginsenosidimutans TaxID=2676868 RepID=UPI0018D246EF|nr:hypothetical protein [Phnomibacter ginsenosidimutans]